MLESCQSTNLHPHRDAGCYIQFIVAFLDLVCCSSFSLATLETLMHAIFSWSPIDPDACPFLLQPLRPWCAPWSCWIIWLRWTTTGSWPSLAQWWPSSPSTPSLPRWSSRHATSAARTRSFPSQPCYQVCRLPIKIGEVHIGLHDILVWV